MAVAEVTQAGAASMEGVVAFTAAPVAFMAAVVTPGAAQKACTVAGSVVERDLPAREATAVGACRRDEIRHRWRVILAFHRRSMMDNGIRLAAPGLRRDQVWAVRKMPLEATRAQPCWPVIALVQEMAGIPLGRQLRIERRVASTSESTTLVLALIGGVAGAVMDGTVMAGVRHGASDGGGGLVSDGRTGATIGGSAGTPGCTDRTRITRTGTLR
jgi:hypothetical protein